ncbi:hypothetical protein SAMN02745221_02071 [Thermosyntropha lipolytica DSM 11003]|uniref:Uncharacterized protein n=1 Tax=Thermosyntropha lipolytica DSM 11003 TaxID=1123382 RepID=A0A1M5RNT3_9FIRM|nr:hypothetical protein [Thermosyntropha lipolytica]SHH27758.1 hypothetical protein SAMN02745221_02071 [Thermosyntropha lipolytica DSM 11003]
MAGNIEYIINRTAFELIAEEILAYLDIDKILGVLINDGLFAMWIYACEKMRLEKDVWRDIERQGLEALERQKIVKFFCKICQLTEGLEKETVYENTLANLQRRFQEIQGRKMEEGRRKKEYEKAFYSELNQFFIDLAGDLPKLLFMRDLMEKVLLYARYHAKAVRV